MDASFPRRQGLDPSATKEVAEVYRLDPGDCRRRSLPTKALPHRWPKSRSQESENAELACFLGRRKEAVGFAHTRIVHHDARGVGTTVI